MTRALNRTTADLSSYPDLVVIYLGMRVNAPRGVRTLISFGPKIRKSVEAQPDGPLLHATELDYLDYGVSRLPWGRGFRRLPRRPPRPHQLGTIRSRTAPRAGLRLMRGLAAVGQAGGAKNSRAIPSGSRKETPEP